MVQHFCHSGQQKCCTVCRKLPQSADSTALLLPGVAKVQSKMACMRRQYSTFARCLQKVSIGDFMGVNSHIAGPDLEGPCGQNPYCCIADLRVKCIKTKCFSQVLQLFHCKWHHIRRKFHRSIGDFMGVNSTETGPDLEVPPAQNPYGCIADLGDTRVGLAGDVATCRSDPTFTRASPGLQS